MGLSSLLSPRRAAAAAAAGIAGREVEVEENKANELELLIRLHP
jgi:outer membrane lipoprotein SlyB